MGRVAGMTLENASAWCVVFSRANTIMHVVKALAPKMLHENYLEGVSAIVRRRNRSHFWIEDLSNLPTR